MSVDAPGRLRFPSASAPRSRKKRKPALLGRFQTARHHRRQSLYLLRARLLWRGGGGGRGVSAGSWQSGFFSVVAPSAQVSHPQTDVNTEHSCPIAASRPLASDHHGNSAAIAQMTARDQIFP